MTIGKDRPACAGARPIRKKYLFFHRPTIGREEIRSVSRVLETGWITKGALTKRFEAKFCEYTGAKYSVGLNSGTAGLHLALVALGIGRGDEVITPAIGFAADANVIMHVGAKPVFADVRPDTLNIDPQDLKKRITKRTKAVILVHMYGYPAQMKEINMLAKKHGFAVIEDACHALGAKYNGRKIGSISDFNIFSFYATKNITTGEGGMLTTNDPKVAEKIDILSLHGISRDAYKRYSQESYRHWDILYPGYKYNMFDIQAALGLEQLKKLNRFLKRRKDIVQMYNRAFSQIPEIQIICDEKERGIESAYHLYPIIVKTEMLRVGRDRIMDAIQDENIGLGVHFRAIHLHPFYRIRFGFKKGIFPCAEYASDRLISLPLFADMSDKDTQDVIRAVARVINYYRKHSLKNI